MRHFTDALFEELFTKKNSSTYNKLLYHGSDAMFNSFNTKLSGKSFAGYSMWGAGVYLTDDRALAESFGKHLYTCRVTLNNPYVIDNSDTAYGDTSPYAEEYFELTAGDNEVLARHGYDGIIVKNTTWQCVDTNKVFRVNEYIIFDVSSIEILYIS